jgi:outer membrane receptor for ferrienterochelin and colicin
MTLDTVSIEALRPYSAMDVQAGGVVIPIEQLRNMPAIAGESDVLKAMQMMPGVQMGNEGTAGIYVRGGSPDQNLILLDEMPVYNVNHLFGYFSLFHPDALKSAELLRGSFPARYGGRLSSVIKLSSREGNRQDYHGSLALSPVSGRFTAEGPLLKDKASFFVAGRRTWLDAIARPVSALLFRAQSDGDVSGNLGYGFHDLIAKLNYQWNDQSQLFLSYYTGRDRASVQASSDFPEDSTEIRSRSSLSWGNHTVSLRYVHTHGTRLFSKVTAGYTQYNFLSENQYQLWNTSQNTALENYRFGNASTIRDWIAKVQQDYHWSAKLALSWGAKFSQKWFHPRIEIRQQSIDSSLIEPPELARFTSNTSSLFVEGDWSPIAWFRLYAGVRGEYFQAQGYALPTLQPRVSMRVALSDRSSIKVAGGYVVQYLHLLTNTGVGLPTDLWVPATDLVPPEESWQGSLGFYHDFSPGLGLSVEGYYKNMLGLIEYEEGASFNRDFVSWESNVVNGQGRSYGVELLLHKTSGAWQGWLSYTLSKTDRTFVEINDGKPFPFRFDRRHNFSLFFSWEPKEGQALACSWTYLSGARASVPTYHYNVPQDEFEGSNSTFNPLTFQEFVFGRYATHLDQRNNYQLPDFHKLDISYRWSKVKTRGHRSWIVGVYNLYGRFNPVGIFLEQENIPIPGSFGASRPVTRLKAYSYFRWVPSITWERSF